MSDRIFLYIVRAIGFWLAILCLVIMYQAQDLFEAVLGIFGFVWGLNQFSGV